MKFCSANSFHWRKQKWGICQNIQREYILTDGHKRPNNNYPTRICCLFRNVAMNSHTWLKRWIIDCFYISSFLLNSLKSRNPVHTVYMKFCSANSRHWRKQKCGICQKQQREYILTDGHKLPNNNYPTRICCLFRNVAMNSHTWMKRWIVDFFYISYFCSTYSYGTFEIITKIHVISVQLWHERLITI